MSYCYDFNMEQCDADRALASLTQANRLVCLSMSEVQSHSDLKAHNYGIIDACYKITKALSQNLEDYSRCSESNYYEKPFREEVRKFIKLYSESVNRTNLLLELYGRYKSRISSTHAGIIRGYINEIKEHQIQDSEFVYECQEILESYTEEI